MPNGKCRIMKVDTKKLGNVVVFAITGDIVFYNLNQIREVIKSEIEKAVTNKFLMNLSGVGMVDSVGVGFILSAYKTVLSKKGSFSLVAPGEVVKSMLEKGGLTRLKIYDSEDDAIKAI